MIAPSVDFTGQFSPDELARQDLSVIGQHFDDLASASAYLESLKIALYDNIDVTINTSVSGTIATIAHGLGYAPQFLVYRTNAGQSGTSNNYSKLPYFAPSSDPFAHPDWVAYKIYAYADTANLYLSLDLGSVVPPLNQAMHFRYYIFSQPQA